MRCSLRNALVPAGLIAVVYGTASLTGGWLGMPPWWDRISGYVTYSTGFGPVRADGTRESFCERRAWDVPPVHCPRDSDAIFGGGLVLVGLVVTAFGARARRPRPSAALQP